LEKIFATEKDKIGILGAERIAINLN